MSKKLSPRDVLAGITAVPRDHKPKAKCLCGNPVENRWGTCDECQDGAYNGDANGVW